MSNTTFERRLDQLIKDVENHNHRDELLALMQEQHYDDIGTPVLNECQPTMHDRDHVGLLH